MDYFNYIEIILLVILLIILVKISMTPASYPGTWKTAVRAKKVPAHLIRLLRTYPDKQRFFIFWLQIKRIQDQNIEGDFAELGVYKGESARLINAMAPGKRLHLFDTFEGFDEKDLKNEKGEASTYTKANFADTSVETVKQRLHHDKMLVFHPGYFPETAKKIPDQKYAFVNIDVDLYNPTLAGLQYFYPRLSKGGVLILHDYNAKWPMLMKAIDDFVRTIPENPALLPDRNNSLMIVKNN